MQWSKKADAPADLHLPEILNSADFMRLPVEFQKHYLMGTRPEQPTFLQSRFRTQQFYQSVQAGAEIKELAKKNDEPVSTVFARIVAAANDNASLSKPKAMQGPAPKDPILEYQIAAGLNRI